eukprot:snap_masked-scaffold_7-processed-gene-11.27-mRNA-1 protein AED:1.00 eAED:1.00 QI:0/0/0/0/1/1/3/0/435
MPKKIIDYDAFEIQEEKKFKLLGSEFSCELGSKFFRPFRVEDALADTFIRHYSMNYGKRKQEQKQKTTKRKLEIASNSGSQNSSEISGFSLKKGQLSVTVRLDFLRSYMKIFFNPRPCEPEENSYCLALDANLDFVRYFLFGENTCCNTSTLFCLVSNSFHQVSCLEIVVKGTRKNERLTITKTVDELLHFLAFESKKYFFSSVIDPDGVKRLDVTASLTQESFYAFVLFAPYLRKCEAKNATTKEIKLVFCCSTCPVSVNDELDYEVSTGPLLCKNVMLLPWFMFSVRLKFYRHKIQKCPKEQEKMIGLREYSPLFETKRVGDPTRTELKKALEATCDERERILENILSVLQQYETDKDDFVREAQQYFGYAENATSHKKDTADSLIAFQENSEKAKIHYLKALSILKKHNVADGFVKVFNQQLRSAIHIIDVE